MRINPDPRLPEDASLVSLKNSLKDILRGIAQQLNGVSEGSISARHQAATAAPATGKYKQGDSVTNKEPEELGTTGSLYVITGWLCVADGEPGTWVECRSLTGN